MAVVHWRGLLSHIVLLAGSCCLAAPALGQVSAIVNVDSTTVRSVMSPLGLGVHTSPYYNSLSNAGMDERLEAAGVTTMRFGGGGYADVLHWSIARPQWESGVVGGGLSPWFGNASDFGYVGPGSDFGSFVKLLDQTDNSRAVVTVNYGSALKLVNGQSAVPDFGGQPKEAAAWVAYANADPAIYGTPNDIPLGVDQQGNNWKTAGYWARLRASTPAEFQSWASSDGVYEPLNQFLAIDRDAPVGIEHWEIGNETFGTGYYDGSTGYSVDYDLPYGANRELAPELSPARYAQDLVEYAQLMRSVDPTIKIGAVLATPPDDTWSYADLNGNNSRQSNEPYWNDEVLANAASEIDFVMVHWYPYVGENSDGAALLDAVADKIGPMISGPSSAGRLPSLRDSLATHGIPDAEIMVTEFNYFGSLQNSLADAAESLFVADAYASWLEQGVTSVQYLELLTKDFLSDSSGLDPGSAYWGVSLVDKLAKHGDAYVDAQSSESSVRIHAAVQADGSVAVMLLNTALSGDATVAIDIEGVSLGGDGVRYTLTGGDSLVASPLSGVANGFSTTVGPRSAQVLVLSATAALAGDFNGDGVVDAADYTVWRDDPSFTPADYADWQANYGSTTVTGSFAGTESPAGTGVPEPASALLVSLIVVGACYSTRRRHL
ncbi:hypothetical protein Pla108_40540 [Botrimarina colliarenosi]|uniref:Uncharacterized protein n=1 Tax=Botrimarina colliarenosi TaxID=2528001 RepID=A0A5C5ZZC3_9BACT|nr:hypothetical protein [Botrimarina colliarenosi]TWT92914.1 hypothetical protein Pla108_40540 [Botrimarina colliarenosi]